MDLAAQACAPCFQAAKNVAKIATADGDVLPVSRVQRHVSRTPKDAKEWVIAVATALIVTVIWLLERISLLFIAGLYFVTSPPYGARSTRIRKALAWIAANAFKIAALFLGVTIATFHTEYIESKSPDALLQWLHDAQRLAIAPTGGLYEIPLPPPLPRALDDSPRRKPLHHMTVATKFEENLFRLLRSAAWHGDTVDVMGRNDPRLQSWGNGFGVKVQMLLEYCDSLPPDDIVLFTDAYDVLMLGSHERALAGYREVLALNGPETDPTGAGRLPDVVFTAEVNCAPDEHRAKDYPAQDRQHLFAYLNSGLIMGTAGGLSRLVREYRPMDFMDNDQRWFTDLYIDSTRNASMVRAVLDHGTNVFLSMTFRDVWSDLVYSPVDRSFRHAVTGNVPSVIHYPGWVWMKQHVQTWHLLQGANNAHCGLYMCMPLYAGRALVLTLLIGTGLGLAWGRVLPSCKIGRAITAFAADAAW